MSKHMHSIEKTWNHTGDLDKDYISYGYQQSSLLFTILPKILLIEDLLGHNF